MILETLRKSLAGDVQQVEQDLLIGKRCLALTKEERSAIENLHVATYQKESQDSEQIAQKVAEGVARAKIIGAASGAVVGAATGGGVTWRYTKNPLATACGGSVGGVFGGATGILCWE